MVSLSMEQEPMLPTIASEKAPMDNVDDGHHHLTYTSIRPKKTKMDMFKSLLIAVSLMLMGASILKITQGQSQHHHSSHVGMVKGLEHGPHGGPHPHGPPHGGHHHEHDHNHDGPPPPHHFPPHHFPGHGPHGPFHGRPFPKPVDCFVLEDAKALNFNMTIHGMITNLFLERSLGGATVDIKRSFEKKPELIDPSWKEGQSSSPHHGAHGPEHKGPPGPPGPPRGRPHPHRRTSTVQVNVKKLSTDLIKTSNETYVCSLALPFGKMGLGLFHEDITKHGKKEKKHDDSVKEEPKKPKKPEVKPFAPVSLELTIPAGPFMLTEGPPPHHFFHGKHPHGPRKGLKSVIDFFKGKRPCIKKHI